MGVSQGHLWRARKAIYGLADGSGAFFEYGSRGIQDGLTSAQIALDPCASETIRVPEKEDSFLTSDSGADDGEEIVGLMSMRLGDLLLKADDRARELAGFLDLF